MKRIHKLVPHAAILLANMYYVLFAIDRVNKAMNFIDNGITKTLLALMSVLFAVMLGMQAAVSSRSKSAGKGAGLKVLLGVVGMILGLVYLILFIVDLCMGGESMIMYNEAVKYMLLALCLTTTACGVLLAAAMRREARSLRKKAKKPVRRAKAAQGDKEV